jgi:hypothetical protein
MKNVLLLAAPGEAATGVALVVVPSLMTLVTLYLACVGIEGQWTGRLLWPAVAGHAVLTLLLGAAWRAARTTMKGALATVADCAFAGWPAVVRSRTLSLSNFRETN